MEKDTNETSEKVSQEVIDEVLEVVDSLPVKEGIRVGDCIIKLQMEYLEILRKTSQEAYDRGYADGFNAGKPKK